MSWMPDTRVFNIFCTLAALPIMSSREEEEEEEVVNLIAGDLEGGRKFSASVRDGSIKQLSVKGTVLDDHFHLLPKSWS